MTINEPIPFAEAKEVALAKVPVASKLTSAQWSQIEADVRRRAVFSATLDKASVLNVIQDNLAKIVSNEPIAEEGGRLRSIPEAKAQLKAALYKAGVEIAPVGTPRIKDFYSDARRSLIIETLVRDTLGAGRWIAGQQMLEVLPGYELIRVRMPKGGVMAERNWRRRWKDARATVDPTGTTDGSGRMVALKNHPIWQALGDGAGGYTDTLGNPWAPFAFNSGMDQKDVERDECIEMGLMTDETVIAPDTSFNLNGGLQANVARFSTALQGALASNDLLQVVDGVLSLIGNRALLNAYQPSEPRDERGRWALRGMRAVKTALREKKDAVAAMVHPTLGPIDFVYHGRGGKGLAGIVDKHGEASALQAPRTIAFGKLDPRAGNTQVIVHDGWRAVLTRSPRDKRHWLLTSYQKKEERLSNSREDLIPSSLRTPGLHWARPRVVAVAHPHINHARSRIKRVLFALKEAA